MELRDLMKTTEDETLKLQKDVRSMAMYDLHAPYRMIHLLQRGEGSRMYPHFHDFYHINYITSGSLNVEIEGKEHSIHTGQVMILPPNIPHGLRSDEGYHQIGIDMYAKPDERGIYNLFKATFPKGFAVVTLTGAPTGFEELYRTLRNMTALNVLKITNTVESIILKVMEQSNNITNPDFRECFLDVLEREDSYLLPLSQICELMRMSKTHLERLVRKEFDCGVVEYCSKMKQVKASLLLQTTDLPIKSIAELLHFYDESHFSSFFKKRSGVTPKKYRVNSRRT